MTTMERPHLRVCQGTGCGASCTSRCHLGEMPAARPPERQGPRVNCGQVPTANSARAWHRAFRSACPSCGRAW